MAIKMPIGELDRLCDINQDIRELICNDGQFWKERIKSEFGDNVTINTEVRPDLSSEEEAEIYRSYYFTIRRNISWYTYNMPDGKFQSINHEVKQLVNTTNNMYILDTNGVLYGKGDNKYHQISTSDDEEYYRKFTMIRLPEWNDDRGIVQISAYGEYVCFVDSMGELWARGDNRWGQIGGMGNAFSWINVSRDSEDPVKIVSAHCGERFLLALDSDNNIWISGDMKSRIYEHYGVADLSFRILFSPSFTVSSISSGSKHAAFLDVEGNLWGTGYITHNESVLVNRSDRPIVFIMDNVKEVSCYGDYIYALTNGNVVYGSSHDFESDFGRFKLKPRIYDTKHISVSKGSILLTDLNDNLMIYSRAYLRPIEDIKAFKIEAGEDQQAFYGYALARSDLFDRK